MGIWVKNIRDVEKYVQNELKVFKHSIVAIVATETFLIDTDNSILKQIYLKVLLQIGKKFWVWIYLIKIIYRLIILEMNNAKSYKKQCFGNFLMR